MQKLVSILFYLKRAKNHSAECSIPIYVRITVDQKRSELSTGRELQPGYSWNSKKGRAIGTHQNVKLLNAFLDSIQIKIHEAHRQLVDSGELITAETVKNKYTGKGEKPRHLIEIFEHHNKQLAMLIGAEYSKGTLVNFNTTLKHLKSFIRWKYQASEIDIRKVDHAFISDFDFYLRSVIKTANNSTVKNMRNFGKIIRNCISNGWLHSNPFVNYKGRMKEVVRDYLTELELTALQNKEFRNIRIEQVRDIFLFSCYTGLAYIDVQKLTLQHVGIGIDGEKWIFTFRQKTDTRSNIPLLPVAQQIIEKYKEHPLCNNRGSLLPVLSNQKMNAYLKEIASLCEINKELTFHIARHTFATTVTLNNGVPIESVSKMLGHSSLKQTQHYAKILDKKISCDMQLLREALINKSTNGNEILPLASG